MTRIDLHPEELLDRAQSGIASADEQLRLKAHLDVCSACRFEHALGTDCRRSVEQQPDDELAMARIRASVARALERRSYAGSRGRAALRPRRWLLLACAAILMVGTGGAATLIWRARLASMEQSKEPPRTVAPGPVSATKASTAEVEPRAGVESEEATAARAPEAPVAARRASRPAADEPPKTGSAAELFARANSLRRQNETAEALRTYRELQRAHPGSPEELVSRVTVGRLLLDRVGNASAALTEFDGYLSRAPGGSLSEEALIGRALALGRLGRTAEEKIAWSALLAAHPASTYAARARDRIAKPAGK